MLMVENQIVLYTLTGTISHVDGFWLMQWILVHVADHILLWLRFGILLILMLSCLCGVFLWRMGFGLCSCPHIVGIHDLTLLILMLISLLVSRWWVLFHISNPILLQIAITDLAVVDFNVKFLVSDYFKHVDGYLLI